jgi:hypothetical protein
MVHLPNEIQTYIIEFVDFRSWSEEYKKLSCDSSYFENQIQTCRFRFIAETLPHLLYDKMAAEQLFLKDDSRRCDTDTDPAFEKRYCDYSFCVKGLDQKAQNRYAWAQMIANCFLKNNIDR